MAKKKTSKKTSKKAPRKTVTPEIVLPTERSVVSSVFEDRNILLLGEKKVGKTLLADAAAHDIDTFFVNYDPEQADYSLFQEHVPDHRTGRAVLKALEKSAASGRFPYNRVCMDGADLAYQECMIFICKQYQVKHPSDGTYGDVWSAVRQEWTSYVRRLLALPCGVWFICHSIWKEVKDYDDNKIERLVPALTASAEEILNGFVDGTFAMDWHRKRRILVVQGDKHITAGHRMDQPGNPHFRDAQTGDSIDWIDMGSSPEEGYGNLIRAFNNKYSMAEAEAASSASKKKKKTAAKKKTTKKVR